MKKLIPIFLLLAFVVQFSCDPEPTFEDTTDVELIFKGKYNAETFTINSDYSYNSNPIRFDQFNFYIGNVVLVKEISGSPEETELVEVDFVELSFKPSEISSAESGFSIIAKNIPIGEYSAIKIGLGVPADLNKTRPADYGSGHPLNKGSHYWAAWESYIFGKTEARIDIDNDGSFSHKLSYHTGSDEAFRTKFFAKDISLVEGTTSTVTLTVDANKMFENVDVMTNTGTHNITDMDIVNKIMDNLQDEALAIE